MATMAQVMRRYEKIKKGIVRAKTRIATNVARKQAAVDRAIVREKKAANDVVAAEKQLDSAKVQGDLLQTRINLQSYKIEKAKAAARG